MAAWGLDAGWGYTTTSCKVGVKVSLNFVVVQKSKGKKEAAYFPNFFALKTMELQHVLGIWRTGSGIILFDLRGFPCEWLHVGSSPQAQAFEGVDSSRFL